MFYTPDTLTVSQGDHITGELVCAPNARNPRDLDITIKYEAPHEAPTEIHYKMCVLLPVHRLTSRGYYERTLTNCQVLINFSDSSVFDMLMDSLIVRSAGMPNASPKITGTRPCACAGTRRRRCCRLHLLSALSCVTRRVPFFCCTLVMQLCLRGTGPSLRTLSDSEHVEVGTEKLALRADCFSGLGWSKLRCLSDSLSAPIHPSWGSGGRAALNPHIFPAAVREGLLRTPIIPPPLLCP